MKKILIIVMFTFFLCGCGKEQYKTCEINVNNTKENYTMQAKYKIYYDGSYVKSINQEKKYESNDEKVLKYFYESETLENGSLNDLYGGFSIVVDLRETEVNVNGKIDFKKANVRKMVSKGYLSEDFVVSGKLTLNGAKEYFEAKGAQCDI